MTTGWLRAILAAMPMLICSQAACAADSGEDVDLSKLSLEELANLPVRSASKRPEPVSAAPTALFVITNEDIESAPATSLPEMLRLAPNLGVQQVDASQYAITARGFNGIETSNKLLVLIDGRTIYTPLSSGVLWELHSPLLEDIDQIEVISGPGGTLHGANAVNGVINVTSKTAYDTLGLLARASAGADERNAALRYGLALGSGGALRLYGNWQDREDLRAGVGPDLVDRRRGWQTGFRADIATATDQFTVQGDVFDQRTYVVRGDGANGQNLLARWSRALSPTSSLRVQAYYDRFEREFMLARDALSTFDVDAQLNIRSGAHDWVFGAGARTLRDQFRNDLNEFRLEPPSRRLWVWNGFIQDRFRISEALSLTAGLKLQESSFSGLEFLPNVRLAWQPNQDSLFWTAVSRAVRTPSRIDRQLIAPPVLVASNFRSEKLVAFEAGYRGRPHQKATLSISAFYNIYDDIRTTEASPGGVLPIHLANGISGHTWGIEAWSTIQARPWWRLSLGASTIWKDLEVDPGHLDLAARDAIGYDPNWQVMARSEMDVTQRLRLTLGARAVDGIEMGPPIGSYVEADARIGYRVGDHIELFVSGLNLLHDRHAESNDPDRAQLPERKVLAGARAQF
jgi:iron complex outermembrane receptor protein